MRRSMRAILTIGVALCLWTPAAGADREPASAVAGAPSGPAADANASTVEKLEQVTREQAEADKTAAAAQQRINTLDDETQKMLSEYRRAVADTESHRAYAAQLGRQIQSQEEELADMQRQLDEVEDTSRAVTPLQQKMLDTLAEFVQLDVPFLLDERTARIKVLTEMMSRADVSISEKYRRIVEAYQVEMDYGRTIEAYEGKLSAGSSTRTARFLRIGRVALLYQTLDGRETGYWNAQARQWLLDENYAHAFKQGVAVAQKISAPEMLLAPVPAPVEARS